MPVELFLSLRGQQDNHRRGREREDRRRSRPRKQVGDGNLASENAPVSSCMHLSGALPYLHGFHERFRPVPVNESTNALIPNRSLPCCCRLGPAVRVRTEYVPYKDGAVRRPVSHLQLLHEFDRPVDAWRASSFRLGFITAGAHVLGRWAKIAEYRVSASHTVATQGHKAFSLERCSVQREANAPDTVRPCGGVLVQISL